MDEHARLSRRERQIMDIVYLRGEASATQVVADLPDFCCELVAGLVGAANCAG